MRSKTTLFTVLLTASLLVSVSLSLIAPTPETKEWLNYHLSLILSVATGLLYIGGAILFALSLGEFTPTLKRAYAFLCTGLALFGVAVLQLPIFAFMDRLGTLWQNSNLGSLPYIFSLIFIFIGTRAFARLFALKNISMSPWFVFLTPIGIGLLFSFVPHVSTAVPEVKFDGANVFVILSMFVMLIVTLHVFQVRRTASVLYTSALAWLALGFTASFSVGIFYLAGHMVLDDSKADVIATVVLVPSLVAAILLIVSAIEFNRIPYKHDTLDKSVARNFFGRPLHPKEGANLTSVDIVIYIVNLVSNPREIDPILDKMRVVTARQNQDTQKSLSKEDEQALKEVYLEIEQYLITREPVRKFTKQSLREHVAKALQPSLSPYPTFWKDIVIEAQS